MPDMTVANSTRAMAVVRRRGWMAGNDRKSRISPRRQGYLSMALEWSSRHHQVFRSVLGPDRRHCLTDGSFGSGTQKCTGPDESWLLIGLFHDQNSGKGTLLAVYGANGHRAWQVLHELTREGTSCTIGKALESLSHISLGDTVRTAFAPVCVGFAAARSFGQGDPMGRRHQMQETELPAPSGTIRTKG